MDILAFVLGVLAGVVLSFLALLWLTRMPFPGEDR